MKKEDRTSETNRNETKRRGPSVDVGDETTRNFRYQHSYGVILLAAACRGDRPYAAIWCEHHEDILAERRDGNFDAWQIKTRKPEAGFWTLSNADFVGALKKFSDLAQSMGERITGFYFTSNTGFAKAGESANKSRLMRSPIALIAAVQASTSRATLGDPFDQVVEILACRCDVLPDRLYETLSRVHLVQGPSRGEIDASLSNEHLARIDAHAHRSAAELDDVRDELVAKVARASSLHITDPERHLRAVTAVGGRDPALFSKRVAIEVIASAESRRPAKAIKGDDQELHAKIDDLLQRFDASGVAGGLNRGQVRSLLRAFSEVDVDTSEAMDLLLQKAAELSSLRQEVARQMIEHIQDNGWLAPVVKAFDSGDFDKADDCLEELASSGSVFRDATLVGTARLYGLRASLAMARLRYQAAADHYGTAAAIVGVLDEVRAFDLLGRQAEAYVAHAQLHGGLPAFRQALTISLQRLKVAPRNSQQYEEATLQLINYLGVASEAAPRSEAKEMVSIAVTLGQPLLERLEARGNFQAWVSLANNLGAILNSGARFVSDKGASDSTNEAVNILTRTARTARKCNHPDLNYIHSNLATAYRLRAHQSTNPRLELKRSVVHRLRALGFRASMSEAQLGNAYDSLGNDYAELAGFGPQSDRTTFLRGMASYRKALSHRSRDKAPIKWGRTQYNIAGNYLRASRLATGQVATRHGDAALARFDQALLVLNEHNAPYDWVECCFQAATTVAWLMSVGCNPDIDRVQLAIDDLVKLGDVADRMNDLDLVVRVLEVQAQFARQLFESRVPVAASLIELMHDRLLSRMDRFQQTPLRLLFTLAHSQLSFMLAHLAGSMCGVDEAIAAVEDCTKRLPMHGENGLLKSAREVLFDMRQTRNRM